MIATLDSVPQAELEARQGRTSFSPKNPQGCSLSESLLEPPQAALLKA
jgi:hypothetical protein